METPPLYGLLGGDGLDDLRHVGDPEADRLVEELMASGNKTALYYCLGSGNREEHCGALQVPEALTAFMCSGQLPTWANYSEMDRASEFFRSQCNEMLFLLGVLSLPYCYAAAKGAKALYLSEKIRSNTELRLIDTALFIMEVMAPGAFTPGGAAYRSANQVRLRHALARYYISRHPDFKNMGETPINQEDMAGTNLAFSYIALGGLERIGKRPSQADKEAYVHLWAVIGHLMGVRDEVLARDLRSAYWLEGRIRRRQFGVSEEGQSLMKSLAAHFRSNIPNRVTAALLPQLLRYLLGNEVASVLGIKAPLFRLGRLDPMALLPVVRPLIFPPKAAYDVVMELLRERRGDLVAALAPTG